MADKLNINSKTSEIEGISVSLIILLRKMSLKLQVSPRCLSPYHTAASQTNHPRGLAQATSTFSCLLQGALTHQFTSAGMESTQTCGHAGSGAG